MLIPSIVVQDAAFLFSGLFMLDIVQGASNFPNINMTDTDGNAIQAHGGSIIQSGGSYYWFGEDKTGESTAVTFQAVNCYRSSDLATWSFQGTALVPEANTNISSDSVVERPKVIYNSKNDEYVMWFHSDNSSYGLAMVGVATSPTVDGSYTYKTSFQPLGTDSRDMTVWTDPDNDMGYLIFASDGNADLKVASLDADYYNVTEQLFIWESVFWEAPGVLKVDDTFYLLYSDQDGWTPTDNYYMTSTNMSGPWSSQTLLASEGLYAYNTQNTYELTVNGTGGTVYLYLGDHWHQGYLDTSTYALYPLNVGSGLSITYSPGYSLDVAAGTWQNLDATMIATSQLQSSSGNGSAPTVSCATCASGKAVNMTSLGSCNFAWSGAAGNKVLQIKYTYDAGKQDWNNLGISLNGTDYGSALLESTRNASNYFDAPVQLNNVQPGDSIELALLNRTGPAVLVTSVDVFDWS